MEGPARWRTAPGRGSGPVRALQQRQVSLAPSATRSRSTARSHTCQQQRVRPCGVLAVLPLAPRRLCAAQLPGQGALSRASTQSRAAAATQAYGLAGLTSDAAHGARPPLGLCGRQPQPPLGSSCRLCGLLSGALQLASLHWEDLHWHARHLGSALSKLTWLSRCCPASVWASTLQPGSGRVCSALLCAVTHSAP